MPNSPRSVRTLIISDLHLSPDEAEKTQLFVQFCAQTRAERLFILGDLFNAWLGDDVSIALFQDVIAALKKLSLRASIFVMVGNRDFLLREDFAEQSGATLIQSPYLLSTNFGDYVLMHGDEFCTDDLPYQRLKNVLQHPMSQFILLHLSQKWRLKLWQKLRQKSTQAQQHKPAKIMDVSQKTVDDFMQKYPNSDLIHGHTHRQNTHVEANYTRYVLGDWSAEQGNAIVLDGVLNRLEIYRSLD